MNAKPFTHVRHLRSIAPLPIGTAYTRTLIHVFHLYGFCTRGIFNQGHPHEERGLKSPLPQPHPANLCPAHVSGGNEADRIGQRGTGGGGAIALPPFLRRSICRSPHKNGVLPQFHALNANQEVCIKTMERYT